MKKTIATVAAAGAILLSALPVFAGNPKDPADFHGLDHPGVANQLYMYEKTGDPDWDIVEDGAWGSMTYNTKNDLVVFNGHGLEPETDYTLIQYTDPWPGSPVCIDSGTSDADGDIHLSGTHQVSSGEKYWLVLSSDVNCNTPAMTAWNPTEYLFEYNVTP